MKSGRSDDSSGGGEKKTAASLTLGNQAGDFPPPLSLFASLFPLFAMSKSAKSQQQNKLPDELVEKLETSLLLALSKQGDGSPIDSGDFAASFGLKPIDVVGLVKSLTGAEMVEAKVRKSEIGAVATPLDVGQARREASERALRAEKEKQVRERHRLIAAASFGGSILF